MYYRTKKPSVAVYGPLYRNPGVHMYAVGANANDIGWECRKALAAIVSIGGHSILEDRESLSDGYIKVTFTYEID